MMDESINDQILQVKLTYLNGYLAALGFVNSYSIIGMRYKLHLFKYIGGNIERAIQNNSYDLFGVYPNDWEIEIDKADNWSDSLENEFLANFKRRIPSPHSQLDYAENDLVLSINSQIRAACRYFIHLLKNDIINDTTAVHELRVTKGSSYRFVGLDLIFEISDTNIIVLQMLGID
jgi:hypothetical protein